MERERGRRGSEPAAETRDIGAENPSGSEAESKRLASLAFAALRRARELDAILDALSDAVLIFDAQGVAARVNSRARELPADGNERWAGLRLLDEHGEPLAEDSHPVARALGGERVDEVPVALRAGRRRTLTMLASAFPFSRGKHIEGAVLILRDVTDREALRRRLERATEEVAALERAEEALRESEERYRREGDLLRVVMENGQAHLAYLDRDFRFMLVNTAYARCFGVAPADLIGRDYFEVFPSEENGHVFTRVRDSGRAAHFNTKPIELPDRGTTYWNWTLTPITGEDGKTEGFVLSLVDLTERVREERLREGLNELWGTLNSTLDVDDIARCVTRDGAALLGCEAAYATMLQGSDWVVRQAWGLPGGTVGSLCPSDGGCHSPHARRRGRPVVLHDAESDERTCGLLKERCKSALVLPLVARDRPIGTLSFLMVSRRRRFSHTEVDFAAKLAAATSLSIENAALLQERKEAAERNEALTAVGLATGSTLDFDEILHRVVSETTAVLGADSAGVMLLSEGAWSMRYVFGLPPDRIGRRFAEETSPLLHDVLAGAGTSSVEDAEADPVLDREFLASSGIGSFVAAPLQVGRRVFGVLTFNFHERPRRFDPTEIEFVDRVGLSASYALENARLYAERKQADALNKTLNSINAAINSTLERDEIMQRVLHESSRVLDCESAAILLRADDDWTVAHGYRLPEGLEGRRLSEEDIPHVRLAIQQRRPLGIPDIEATPLNRGLTREMGVRACLVVPFSVKGQVQGVLSLCYHGRRFSFTNLQMDFARKLSSAISLALENSRLYEAERGIADTLQEALLTVPARIEGLEFDTLYRSATKSTKVGGDFYDLFELTPSTAGVVIGDVSGKGLEAAVLTSLVKNTIKAYAHQGLPPSEVMRLANEVVRRSSSDSTFVTVFFGLLDLATGRLRFCNAGHPPAMLKQARRVALLGANSPIMGAFPNVTFREGTGEVRGGDLLLLYTDGLTEARCAGGFYGEERLVRFVRDLATSRPREVLRAMFQELMIGTKGILADDVAMLAASVVGRRRSLETLPLWTEE